MTRGDNSDDNSDAGDISSLSSLRAHHHSQSANTNTPARNNNNVSRVTINNKNCRVVLEPRHKLTGGEHHPDPPHHIFLAATRPALTLTIRPSMIISLHNYTFPDTAWLPHTQSLATLGRVLPDHRSVPLRPLDITL